MIGARSRAVVVLIAAMLALGGLATLGRATAVAATTTSLTSGTDTLGGPLAPGTGRTGLSATLTRTTASTATAPPGTPVLVSSQTTPPSGYHLNAQQVLAIARRDPRVQAQLRQHTTAIPYEYTKGAPTWQVSWFSPGRPQKELIQVYVDDNTHVVTQVWSGFQVAWTMARGYPGAFGRRVNAWYLWLPLCLLFVAPFVRRRPSLLHLDLAALLFFSVSLAFFNHADIGLSVPLIYPPLIYLLVRMLLLANGRGRPRSVPLGWFADSWLAVGTVFLMAFRIGLNVLNSNVIDVGYAGVIGADKLIHGAQLYGNWPHDNQYGDTYGPLSYIVYVPFRLIFGWSGTWDSLPAAHAAAIAFDLLTLLGLFVLGRRLRGNGLGWLLAYCWAAYPFTLYAMNSNTNDSLVAATIVGALLVLSSAPGRGVAAALAGVTKFAPLALAPLFWRGIEDRPRKRSLAAYVVAFAFTVLVLMLPVLLNADLGHFWHDSIQYQSDRVTPFSVYGLWGGLGAVQHILQGAVIALALAAGLLPSRRGPVEVAALAAAIILALQLTLNYWLYPYIVWFVPMVFVAILAGPGELLAAPDDPGPASVADAQPEPIAVHITSA